MSDRRNELQKEPKENTPWDGSLLPPPGHDEICYQVSSDGLWLCVKDVGHKGKCGDHRFLTEQALPEVESGTGSGWKCPNGHEAVVERYLESYLVYSDGIVSDDPIHEAECLGWYCIRCGLSTREPQEWGYR